MDFLRNAMFGAVLGVAVGGAIGITITSRALAPGCGPAVEQIAQELRLRREKEEARVALDREMIGRIGASVNKNPNSGVGLFPNPNDVPQLTFPPEKKR
jgi:hypothetical protein